MHPGQVSTVMQLESQTGDLLGDNHQRPDQQTQEDMS